MGYTHYWRQSRAFTVDEWNALLTESQRICAKAINGLYSGKEDFESATAINQDAMGFRVGFKESYAWRTFPHPEAKTPMKNAGIVLVGPSGEKGTTPIFSHDRIALNGVEPNEDYESFIIERDPSKRDNEKESFAFCKTEYRPYDAVVVSILAAAQIIAPSAIKASSDGGKEAIKLMF